MVTIDTSGNLHDGVGRFTEKSNSAPSGSLVTTRGGDPTQWAFEEIELGDEGQRVALAAALSGDPIIVLTDSDQHDDAIALVYSIARLRETHIEAPRHTDSVASLVGGGPAVNWDTRPKRPAEDGDGFTVEAGAHASIAELADGSYAAFGRSGISLGTFATQQEAQDAAAADLIAPGSIARANDGVLLLENAHDFQPQALDALRQPLETGTITVARGGVSRTFDARVQVAMVSPACPCGDARACECTTFAKRRYRSRLSGPLLDRTPNRLRTRPGAGRGAMTEAEARRVLARARSADAAAASWIGADLGRPDVRSLNDLSATEVSRWTRTAAPELVAPLDRQLERGAVTMRRYDRALRKAWSLAALDGSGDLPTAAHVDEALKIVTTSVG